MGKGFKTASELIEETGYCIIEFNEYESKEDAIKDFQNMTKSGGAIRETLTAIRLHFNGLNGMEVSITPQRRSDNPNLYCLKLQVIKKYEEELKGDYPIKEEIKPFVPGKPKA